MKTYIDISKDLDAYENPIEIDSEDAVIEAVNLWLRSSTNDYLMKSRVGGPLDHMVFKNINDTMEEAEFLLEIELRKTFGAFLVLQGVLFEPDHELGIMRIQVNYTVRGKEGQQKSEVYVKQSKMRPQYETFYEVTDTGDQLISFITLYKPNFPNNILEYNYTFDTWQWGPFKLLNLSIENPEYLTIRSLLNS